MLANIPGRTNTAVEFHLYKRMIAGLILLMKLTVHGFFREIENEIETEAKALDLSLSNIVEVTHLSNTLSDVVDNQFSNQVKDEGVYCDFLAKENF